MLSLCKVGRLDVLLLLLVSLVVFCAVPLDPSDPENTTITPLVKNRYNAIEEKVGTDSLGNTVYIGAALHLPENIDSVLLEIEVDGETVFDTMYREFDLSVETDTIWKEFFFETEGNKKATFTPWSSVKLSPVIASVIIAPNPKYNENHPPVLRVTGSTINRLMETVELEIAAVDGDSGQEVEVMCTKSPENAEFNNHRFTWTPPGDFSGTKVVQFVAEDNGTPPMFDTVDISLIVTATPSQPSLLIGGNRIVKPGEICTLTLAVTDEDEGQEHSLEITGNPENVVIEGDSLFIWSVPESAVDGDYSVAFTVMDNGIPPLSRSTEVTLSVSAEGITGNVAPFWYTDTLYVIVDEPSYSLPLETMCGDANGDELSFTLLSGNPENDAIIDGEYIFITAEGAEGKHLVKIVVEDTGEEQDTLVIRMEVANVTGNIISPEITNVPNDTTVAEGGALQFTVAFNGTSPEVQWRKDGADIEDDVIIYANATILGGQTIIGKGSIIGGNTWITESVPPGTHIYNRDHEDSIQQRKARSSKQ